MCHGINDRDTFSALYKPDNAVNGPKLRGDRAVDLNGLHHQIDPPPQRAALGQIDEHLLAQPRQGNFFYILQRMPFRQNACRLAMGQGQGFPTESLGVERDAKGQIAAVLANHLKHFRHADIGDLHRRLWMLLAKLGKRIQQEGVTKDRLRRDHKVPNLTAGNRLGFLLQIAQSCEIMNHALMKTEGFDCRREAVSLALEEFEPRFLLQGGQQTADHRLAQFQMLRRELHAAQPHIGVESL